MNNNLTLSVTLTGDNRQLSGTLKDAQGDVREFSTTTERESKKAETALEAPGRSAITVSDHLRETQREARTFGTETDRSSRQASRALAQTGDQAQTVTGQLDQMRGVAVAVGVAMATMGVREFVAGTYAAVSSSQQLQASLKTVTGSIENASTAWNTLLGFAAETPFTLDQSVQAFIRMQSLGLNPSLEALRSYGNTASAMGKDMMQMVEAVADATTGEFERLKEFGIRASKEGEQISFTFQGVTTTVANSANAISQYLQQIGENQFAGAMGDQMDTLSGKASNLEDTVYQFYLAIGDAGATEVFESTLANASNTVQFLTDNIDTLASGAEVMAVLIGGRVVVALANVTAAKLAATQQTIAYQLALARMAGVSGTAAAAQTALAGASRAAAGALTLVGGPVGAAMLAGGAIFYFREELGLVAPKVQSATDRVDDMTSALDANSEAALKNARAMLEAEQQFQQFRQAQLAMDVSRQRQIVADEQRQWDAVGGQQAFGMGQASESQQALQDLQIQLMDTRNAIDAAGGSVTEIDEKLALLEKTTRDTIPPTTELGDANETAAAKAKELTDATDAQAKALEDLRNRLIPGRRETVQLARDVGTLNLAMATGTGNIAQHAQMMQLLTLDYLNAQGETENLADTAEDAGSRIGNSFTTWGTVADNTLRNVDDAGRDAWLGLVDGSTSALDTIERAFEQTAANILHMLTTQKFTFEVAGVMGLDTTGMPGGGQQSGMSLQNINPQTLQSGWNTVSGWFGGGSSSAPGGLYGGANTGAVSGTLYGSAQTGAAQGGLYGNAATGGIAQGGAMSNVAGGLYTAGASFVGGYAGSEFGQAAFGKQANSNIGQTIGTTAGAVIGSAIPGIGTAIGAGIGSFLGSTVDVLFGSGRKSYGQIGSQIGGDRNAGDGVYRYDRNDRSQGYAQESAFGTIGVTKKQKTDDDALIEMVAAFAQIDNALAAVMTGAQLENTREALDGWTSSRTKNIGGIVDERLSAVLNATNSAFTDVLSQFEGDALVQGLVGGLQIENVGQQMAGAVAADMNAEFRSALSSGSNVEAATQSILASAQAVEILGAGADRLNIHFNDAASGALSAAGNIASLVGGVENLSALQSQYYATYFTESERAANLQDDLTASLANMGMQLPESRDGFRSLVEAQDLNTEAGQRNYAQLLSVAGSFDQLQTSLGQAGTSVNAAEQQILDLYESITGQRPDADGGAIQSYISKIDSGAITLEQALSSIEKEVVPAAHAVGLVGEYFNESLREREQLERQLLQAQGDTDALRERELQALREIPGAEIKGVLALQERIWALEDASQAEQEAAQQQAQIAQERQSLEQQLLQVQGDTSALRALELASLDPSNQSLQERIWSLQDEQEQQAALAQQQAQITQERQSLEQQLLQVQGDTSALRALELAALDPSNQALQERIWSLQDEQEQQAALAQQQAQIAQERQSLEQQLLQVQGDTSALRALELASLAPSNQALQERIWSLQDEQEQQAALAQQQAQIAQERQNLEQQLLQVQGDTSALRALELAALDPSNQALQEHIWAIQDQAAAAEEAAQAEQQLQQSLESAASTALRALDQSIRAERDALNTSHSEHLERIAEQSTAQQTAYTTAQSALESITQAANGMQLEGRRAERMRREQAVETLREMVDSGSVVAGDTLNRALDAASNISMQQYTSTVDYLRDYAQTAALIADAQTLASEQVTVEERTLQSLESRAARAEAQHQEELAALNDTYESAERQYNALMGIDDSVLSVRDAVGNLATALAQLSGTDDATTLSIPGFATGGAHAGGLRVVGERGPELEFTGPSRIVSNSDSRALLDFKGLIDELKALRKQVAAQQKYFYQMTLNTGQSAKYAKKLDLGGVKIKEPSS